MPTDNKQTNGFMTHNINHLSPSSLNLSMGSMSAWCVRYLMGQRFPSGVAAERGKAAELGVSHGLFTGADDKECIELGLQAFEDSLSGVLFKDSEKIEDARLHIAEMIPLALNELRPIGVPTLPDNENGQHEVGIACRFREGDTGTVHITGFLDFYYENIPLVVDLKTTLRAPSQFSQAHQLQAAIYKKAKKCPVKFLYVTPKKAVWHELTNEQADESLALAKVTVKRLERFLSLSDDGAHLTRSAPHDPSSFYWDGAPAEFSEFLD